MNLTLSQPLRQGISHQLLFLRENGREEQNFVSSAFPIPDTFQGSSSEDKRNHDINQRVQRPDRKKKNIWISKNWEKSEEITANCDAHSEERKETHEKEEIFISDYLC